MEAPFSGLGLVLAAAVVFLALFLIGYWAGWCDAMNTVRLRG